MLAKRNSPGNRLRPQRAVPTLNMLVQGGKRRSGDPPASVKGCGGAPCARKRQPGCGGSEGAATECHLLEEGGDAFCKQAPGSNGHEPRSDAHLKSTGRAGQDCAWTRPLNWQHPCRVCARGGRPGTSLGTYTFHACSRCTIAGTCRARGCPGKRCQLFHDACESDGT